MPRQRDADFQDTAFLCVDTHTFVQDQVERFIFVTRLTPPLIAILHHLWSAVVARRNDSLMLVNENSAYTLLHAIAPLF